MDLTHHTLRHSILISVVTCAATPSPSSPLPSALLQRCSHPTHPHTFGTGRSWAKCRLLAASCKGGGEEVREPRGMLSQCCYDRPTRVQWDMHPHGSCIDTILDRSIHRAPFPHSTKAPHSIKHPLPRSPPVPADAPREEQGLTTVPHRGPTRGMAGVQRGGVHAVGEDQRGLQEDGHNYVLQGQGWRERRGGAGSGYSQGLTQSATPNFPSSPDQSNRGDSRPKASTLPCRGSAMPRVIGPQTGVTHAAPTLYLAGAVRCLWL